MAKQVPRIYFEFIFFLFEFIFLLVGPIVQIQKS